MVIGVVPALEIANVSLSPPPFEGTLILAKRIARGTTLKRACAPAASPGEAANAAIPMQAQIKPGVRSRSLSKGFPAPPYRYARRKKILCIQSKYFWRAFATNFFALPHRRSGASDALLATSAAPIAIGGLNFDGRAGSFANSQSDEFRLGANALRPVKHT